MTAAFFIPFFAFGQWRDISADQEYPGSDLGLTYTARQSFFRIWAPMADQAELILHSDGAGGSMLQRVAMQKSTGGTWSATLEGNHEGKFYSFRVRNNNQWSNEVPDPYARFIGVNGRRAMIIDPLRTNPESWETDKGPRLEAATDAVIYELHVRDASIASNSGIRHKGKYLGLAETGTKNTKGLSTGLDHIKELGVTHVHLLPFYDFLSIDETKPDSAQYNWGYEPLNYNAPEGSYATNPYDGISRNRELKQMVQAFHKNGLGVVMDVVYNHTMLTEDSWFNQLVPGYYYRHTSDGKFSNATACGNETASERPMMRKFMLESLKYWVEEYHIDGFRFDLMGVHDIETMNIIAAELRKIKPGILLYGEGWTADASPLPDTLRALKKFAYKLDIIAVFSDDLRDGIKGSVFVEAEKGFVSGRAGMEESIKFGVVASCPHPQVNYSKVNYSGAPYSKDPVTTVSYAECHDNHVLWDKLALSAPSSGEAARKEMYKLALSIVLTSQGISFLHAGSEFLRSKKGNENSYNAEDSINAIDWDLKSTNNDIYQYVKALVKLRKEHPAFRMRTGKELSDNISFLNVPAGIVAYTLNGKAVKDQWSKIVVVYNSNDGEAKISLPSGNWKKVLLPGQCDQNTAGRRAVQVAARQCNIFYQ